MKTNINRRKERKKERKKEKVRKEIDTTEVLAKS